MKMTSTCIQEKTLVDGQYGMLNAICENMCSYDDSDCFFYSTSCAHPLHLGQIASFRFLECVRPRGYLRFGASLQQTWKWSRKSIRQGIGI